MRNIFFTFLLAIIFNNAFSQNQRKCDDYKNNSIEKINACFVERNYKKSEEVARDFLLKNNNNARGNALLAFSLTRQNNHQESLQYYEKAISLGLKTFDTYAYYALSLDAVGKIDESIQYNKKSLEIVPDLFDVTKTLSEQLAKQNKFDEAISYLKKFDSLRESKGRKSIFHDRINSLAIQRDALQKNNLVAVETQKNIPIESSLDVEKRFLSSCERLIPKNKINVLLNANYYIEKGKSLADITALGKTHGSVAIGLTTIKNSINFKSNYRNHQLSSNLWCGLVNLDIDVNANDFVIYVASEYKEGSCEYNKILEHELMHAKFYIEALNEAKFEIEKKMNEKYIGKILFIRDKLFFDGRIDLDDITAIVNNKMESHRHNHIKIDENLSWNNVMKTCIK